ncbi:hypothetical protein [Baaleninema sp.]|uniref:hypothetical protein n=1 Tax=Baaleninema sp. TaxID=3101197 RepID=UPI003D0505B7
MAITSEILQNRDEGARSQTHLGKISHTYDFRRNLSKRTSIFASTVTQPERGNDTELSFRFKAIAITHQPKKSENISRFFEFFSGVSMAKQSPKIVLAKSLKYLDLGDELPEIIDLAFYKPQAIVLLDNFAKVQQN